MVYLEVSTMDKARKNAIKDKLRAVRESVAKTGVMLDSGLLIEAFQAAENTQMLAWDAKDLIDKEMEAARRGSNS